MVTNIYNSKKKQKKYTYLLIFIIIFNIICTFLQNTEMVYASETDTFTSNGGEYTLEYIFNKYNVFSFGDATGVHIVGPVAAKGKYGVEADLD